MTSKRIQFIEKNYNRYDRRSHMSSILDDWFGFDPPPPVPEPKTPARPAPTRKVATSNVATGVDARRDLTGQGAGSSRTSRTLLVDDDDDILGVGINV